MTANRMGYLAAASMRACVSRLIRPHHRAGQKLCFVSGAENDRDQDGLPRRREHESLREHGFCLRRQHHGPRKSSVLYQVPKMTATRMGYLAAASMRACVSKDFV